MSDPAGSLKGFPFSAKDTREVTSFNGMHEQLKQGQDAFRRDSTHDHRGFNDLGL